MARKKEDDVKIYKGFPKRTEDGGFLVEVVEPQDSLDVLQHALDPRLNLRSHSPCGFAWGYSGSGPAQLALAILADASSDETALMWYQLFKSEVIASLDAGSEWVLSQTEVLRWLKWKTPR